MNKEESHFTKKRVDESWKDAVSKEKGEAGTRPQEPSGVSFSTFITSLGIQTLIRMGELQDPGTGKTETDLEGAREMIDLLLMMKEKTKGNLSNEEEKLITSLIADLQLKFVQHKTV